MTAKQNVQSSRHAHESINMDRMKTYQTFRKLLPYGIAVASLFSVISLPACNMNSHSITPNGAVPSDVLVYGRSNDASAVYGHRNPHPQDWYEMSIKIENAPGAFNRFKATVSLEPKNMTCGTSEGPAWNKRLALPSATVSTEMQKISETEFRVRFAKDILVNESYWAGKPPCEWRMISVDAWFAATGADGETAFNISPDTAEIPVDKPMKRYYWKGGYPRSESDNFQDIGMDSPEKSSKPEVRSNLFTITAIIHKVQP
ncbi:hypothetical protein [Brachymonas sp. M4Q-1]|uniref:hypothetical protein n=1 Tax=Brachymonas sp. M4Q-1 TaxID=3416906 RepID=UPI003CF014A1